MDNCALTNFEIEDNKNFLAKHFSEVDFPASELASQAVENLLAYLHKTVRTDLNHISKLSRLNSSRHLILDATTLKNLEIVRSLRDGSKKDTLFGILDCTRTPMGSRLLKRRLENPLLDVAAINRRLDAVEELVKNFTLRRNLRDTLKDI